MNAIKNKHKAKNKYRNDMKKMILALVLASVSVTCFGCNKDGDSSDVSAEPTETLSLADMTQPLQFSYGNGVGSDAKEPKEDATEGDKNSDSSSDSEQDASKSSLETAPDKPVNVTEYVEVTDASGQPVTDAAGKVQTEVVNVTEQVQVTDPSGQPVTDTAGKTQTEVVNVTEKPAATSPTEGNASSGGEEEKPTEAVSYTPVMDVCNAYWLDMSQESDFFFNGEFLSIEFKVNEGIPDGSYPVTFKKTDIASWDVVKWDPVCINGEVAVNSDVAAQDDFPDEDFALKINSVAAKQGDTVKVTVDLNNNPGFCGFVIELEYDKSALTIVSTESGADFDNAVNYVMN
ncbi:MAG: hypothetical protein K2G25_05885 [Oscillospiraceae bacterium]|nr:hypothetical protein [Oscillospiraceae bacterium]